ncbi:M23 family metallopeptidase [Phenylobacterium sp.]|uniref:M23 family metallopeptidase n=1 Tax=Phenylobacterium sp. TaxID=1871053 RepID=UPI0035B2485A
MISSDLAAPGGLRHFWVEGLIAAAATLGVVTAAFATSVVPTLTARPEPAYQAVVEPVVPPPEPEPAFDFSEPVPGHAVNSPFGLRRMPWETHGRLHEGVDIAAPSGTRVQAVEDGVIVRAGTSASYGRYVEVKHENGLSSFYAHLGRIEKTARAGVAVDAGTVIGRIGSSGISTGPHLHFEIRRGDTPLNPVAFIGREFETVQDLPLRTAASYSKKVRVAQVGEWPASKRKAKAKAAGDAERPSATLAVAE